MAAPFTNPVLVPANGTWISLGTPAAGKNMIIELAQAALGNADNMLEWGLATASADMVDPFVGHKITFKDLKTTIIAPGAQVWARYRGGVAHTTTTKLIVTITQ